MQILLQAGADVQQKFGQGESVAHLYAKSDRAALLQPIHAAGCNLDTHDDSELGETPLYAAAARNRLDVAALLLDAHFSIDHALEKTSSSGHAAHAPTLLMPARVSPRSPIIVPCMRQVRQRDPHVGRV